MKVIETNYNGILFRSRLEARWAIFLDSYKIQYIYELDTYKFDNGEMYCPDFYLPHTNNYLEVKPKYPNNNELQKAFLLSKETNCDVIFGIGIPDYKEYPYVTIENDSIFYDEREKLPVLAIVKQKWYFSENRFGVQMGWGEGSSFKENCGFDYQVAVENSKRFRVW